MRLGINISLGKEETISSSKVIASMRSAERIGFDSLWFFDTIGRGFLTPDPLIQVSVAAAVTERIDVGTCILQVPLRQPVELAHRILTAQLMTGGRLRSPRPRRSMRSSVCPNALLRRDDVVYAVRAQPMEHDR